MSPRIERIVDGDICFAKGPLTIGSYDLDLARFNELSSGVNDEGKVPTRALVLFRRRGWPVGIEVRSLSNGTVDVDSADEADERFGEPESSYSASISQPAMTIVICTCNRPALLALALERFGALAGTEHELIVVDNASSDDATATVVANYPGRVRYVVEPTPGLARARNTGLRLATNRFVAFTDDDVIPDQQWLNIVRATFAAHPGAVCVSGSVFPASLTTEAELRFQEFGGYSQDFTESELHLSLDPSPSALFPFHPRPLGTGANMSFRVEALRSLGGFDEELGAGTPARGGEDIDIGVRLLLAGHLLVRQPSAVLWHPSHTTIDALTKQIEDYGCGLAAVFTKFLHQRKMAPALFKRLPAGVGTMFGSSSSKNEQRSSTYPAYLKRAELRGLAKGPMAYRRSRRAARLLATRCDQ